MIFTTGFIEKNTPYLNSIKLVGKKGFIPLQVVLDTGFTDEFCLPIAYKNKCNYTFCGKDEYVLADGRTITDNLYEIDIVINHQPYTIQASFTDDDECLIGMELLQNKIITLNTKNDTLLITT